MMQSRMKLLELTGNMPAGLLLTVAVLLLTALVPGCAQAEPVAAPSTPLLLHFEALVDGTGELLEGREILVENGVIVAVGDGLAERYPAALRANLDGLTAVPGLIDAHVHMTYGFYGPSHGDAWKQLLQETSAPQRLVAAVRNAARTLQSGVTTARDLFALDGVDFYLRELIEQGVVPGPRLFLSGKGIHPMVMPPQAQGTQAERIASLSQRAAEVAASGADWLKIFATTGTASDLSGEQVYFYAEISAATNIAHAHGLKVALHAYGASAVPDAIRAGVDSIEHAVDVDDETLAAWAASGIAYVPTIDHNRYYADYREEYGFDQQAAGELRDFTARNVEMLRRAHAAGVPIVMGSDAVMSMFGENTRELEWFIKAGMSNAEVLQSATVNGARLLGQQDKLGRLAPGFAADIVAVQGLPLHDIEALTRHVVWVMKNGEVVVDNRTAP